MRTTTVLSAAAAAVVALTLFEASPSEAAVQKRAVVVRKAPVRNAQPRVRNVQPRVHKSTPKITKTPSTGKTGTGSQSTFMKKSVGTGTPSLRRLPLHKAATGNAQLKGRVAVPPKIVPKLSLAHAPAPKFHKHFAPFVQRHWKSAFFWVAVAGIGYLTIPAIWYDPFYACISVADPIYDDCLYILDYAALEEEEVVRISMPPSARYRYTARVPVKDDCPSCRWQRFVERRWNQSYGWVKIPDVGNVTVPDAYYERFYTFAGANPANYPQACRVLEEAASAKEESAVARVRMPDGTEYRYRADTAPTQECKSCTLEPFVERKWNREFVWVQIPQTGNVTVPEDYYDRFYNYAGAEPPNYPAACKVLVEAAAADTVMTTALDTRRELE